MHTYAIEDTDLILDVDPQVVGKEYVLKIRDLPQDDRPREKILALGPGALTVQELLALVVVTGTKKEGVLEMTSRVLKEYGENVLSRQIDATKMAQDLDIPIVKAIQIVACAELGKRFFERNPLSQATIRTAKDVFDNLQDMRTLPKEHMRGLYLNGHYKVIHDEVISIGTVNSNLIHPREVFKPALACGAVAVVLAHNHPSGVVEPSAADIEITKQISAAGKILGIHLIDHVIIGPTSFKSIAIDY